MLLLPLNRWIGVPLLAVGFAPALAAQPLPSASMLKVVYPPPNHETTADRIFLIGTAPPTATVTVNGQVIEGRSPSGHFAPTVPLQLGDNTLTLQANDQTLTLTVKRLSTASPIPKGFQFVEGSLSPGVDIARLPNEPICWQAIAPPQSQVVVRLGTQTIPLQPQPAMIALPPNSAVLTTSNVPTAAGGAGRYQGCAPLLGTGNLGKPVFELRRGNAVVRESGKGTVTVLSPQTLEVVAVTSAQGVARTGPSTDYSRLTPLPKGTQAQVTGREGEWLRLDYGGWIKQSETKIAPGAGLPHSLIRSIRVQTQTDRTQVIFPLQVPVPVAVKQDEGKLSLTLYNTTAQTDTILQTPDRVLKRLDWQQIQPGQIQYDLHLRSPQAWGYQLRYEGTSLVVSLRHPPRRSKAAPLAGTTILLDPGHGSPNDLGAVGPTGYPEKDAALVMSKLLRDDLERRGATVVMTREGDDDLLPGDRVQKIEQVAPTLALSLHYNALPDSGDALKTQGIGMFWYHPQAQSLATFLHDYLVQTLDRPSYGVFWNNLALTRPAITPSVLLELGFMINPEEFEWITDPKAQKQLSRAMADAITLWMEQNALQP